MNEACMLHKENNVLPLLAKVYDYFQTTQWRFSDEDRRKLQMDVEKLDEIYLGIHLLQNLLSDKDHCFYLLNSITTGLSVNDQNSQKCARLLDSLCQKGFPEGLAVNSEQEKKAIQDCLKKGAFDFFDFSESEFSIYDYLIRIPRLENIKSFVKYPNPDQYDPLLVQQIGKTLAEEMYLQFCQNFSDGLHILLEDSKLMAALGKGFIESMNQGSLTPNLQNQTSLQFSYAILGLILRTEKAGTVKKEKSSLLMSVQKFLDESDQSTETQTMKNDILVSLMQKALAEDISNQYLFKQTADLSKEEKADESEAKKDSIPDLKQELEETAVFERSVEEEGYQLDPEKYFKEIVKLYEIFFKNLFPPFSFVTSLTGSTARMQILVKSINDYHEQLHKKPLTLPAVPKSVASLDRLITVFPETLKLLANHVEEQRVKTVKTSDVISQNTSDTDVPEEKDSTGTYLTDFLDFTEIDSEFLKSKEKIALEKLSYFDLRRVMNTVKRLDICFYEGQKENCQRILAELLRDKSLSPPSSFLGSRLSDKPLEKEPVKLKVK